MKKCAENILERNNMKIIVKYRCSYCGDMVEETEHVLDDSSITDVKRILLFKHNKHKVHECKTVTPDTKIGILKVVGVIIKNFGK